MSLKARLKKLEQAVKPRGEIISVDRYPCMIDADIEACVRQQLGREPKDGDVLMVVVLQRWGYECPDAPHTHPEGREGRWSGTVDRSAAEPADEPAPHVEGWVSGVRW